MGCLGRREAEYRQSAQGAVLKIFSIVCFLTVWSISAAAAFVVPPLTGPIVDGAAVVSDNDRRYLEDLIRQVQDATHAQIQVLTVPSLEGEVIERASIQVTDKWKLGLKGDDKGVLLFVAVQERKVRIEVGRGLEGDIPDITAWQIISEQIIPRFHAGDLSGGVVAGVQSIASIVAPGFGVAMPSAEHRRHHKPEGIPMVFVWLILIFLMSTRFGRTILFAGLLQGAFGGGRGDGGGGGWSGGGGGFSGGGASGDW